MDFLEHVLDQAVPAQQMPAELFDELLEARPPLRTCRILMGFGHRRADRQKVAHVERQRLDQDVLVALQFVELP